MNPSHPRIVVTGAAGFIGSHLTRFLLENLPESEILGIDNLNSYYDVGLKKSRLTKLGVIQTNNEKFSVNTPRLEFKKVDIADKNTLFEIFRKFKPTIVINLAAQAGVRYARKNPDSYVASNLAGFVNILEASKNVGCERIIYASSSSVYGGLTQTPFDESLNVNSPLNLYAATKASGELLAAAYAHLFKMELTGLRFFTVYGPAGRPDMAYFSFSEKLLTGEKISLYGGGKALRDYTYIDDICSAIGLIVTAKKRQIGKEHKIFNLGNGHPRSVFDLLNILESQLDIKADTELVNLPADDMPHTFADCSAFQQEYGFRPKIGLEKGLRKFTDWFLEWKKPLDEEGKISYFSSILNQDVSPGEKPFIFSH